MKKIYWIILLGICMIMILVMAGGCSGIGQPTGSSGLTATPGQASSTPAGVDLCSEAEKPAQIDKIVRMMSQFDDTSLLAQSTPQQQLAVVIVEMQRVMHATENMDVPKCLETLQSEQVDYMREVISTMTYFLAGGDSSSIGAQITLTRQKRAIYEAELASQQGKPYSTPTRAPTMTATPVTPTSTPGPVTITTEQDLYVLQGPGVGYPAIGTFLVGQTTNAVGRTEDRQWIEVELVDHPGYTGWVPVETVKINGSVNELAVVPTPPVQ